MKRNNIFDPYCSKREPTRTIFTTNTGNLKGYSKINANSLKEFNEN